MKYTIIEVPDFNDSVSRIVLNGRQYQIRFTYNDRGGFWTFGLMDMQGKPLLIGVKIVPQFPLNLLLENEEMPAGVFAALTRQKRIGRRDFLEGNAEFVFIPAGTA